MDYPQPWFDENGGLYPVYHVIKGLAALRGRPLIEVAISKPREVQAIAVERDGALEVWLANLTDQTETVALTPKFVDRVSLLSASEFERATQDFSAMDSLERPFREEMVRLPPYAVARLRGKYR
jgi:D-apionolactonase